MFSVKGDGGVECIFGVVSESVLAHGGFGGQFGDPRVGRRVVAFAEACRGRRELGRCASVLVQEYDLYEENRDEFEDVNVHFSVDFYLRYGLCRVWEEEEYSQGWDLDAYS